MGKEQHVLSIWIWLFVLLCSYFFILNLYAPPARNTIISIRLKPRDDDNNSSSPGAVTSIQIAATQNDDTDDDEIDNKYPFVRALKTEENKTDPCDGRYVYVHDLPLKFNEDILKECETMDPWMNMCKYFMNNGFGPKLHNSQGELLSSGWYETNQFTLEVIFKNRMEQYDCLTKDSSIAAAIYVPFYAGFDICRHLFNHTTQVRDALSNELVDWLTKTPEWKIMGGKDHFVVAGRVTWAFRRSNMSDWGNKFQFLPEIKNMSTLLIESSSFHSNDFAIPYPTYFHPSNDAQVLLWQERVQKLNRKWLFTFTGATRPNDRLSIRSDIIDQCKHSNMCKLLECAGDDKKNCESPRRIIKGFEESVFCLQPTGDSSTRRSTFDSILAGCIPVFFHPASAYTQYTWHLPKNYSKYSVFIPEDGIRNKSVSIEEILRRISPEQIEEMRGEVINLIPKIVYAAADSGTKSRTFKDAFDIAVEGVIHRVNRLRKDMVKGGTSGNLHEELSWKYSLFEEDDDDQTTALEKPHEWDHFFQN